MGRDGLDPSLRCHRATAPGLAEPPFEQRVRLVDVELGSGVSGRERCGFECCELDGGAGVAVFVLDGASEFAVVVLEVELAADDDGATGAG